MDDRWVAIRQVARLLAALSLGVGCRPEATDPSAVSVRVRWSQPQPGYAEARPATSGGLVYFGSGDGQVIARDRKTGSSRWTARVGGGERVEAANFAVGAGVVVAPVVRHLSGLDAATGRVLWLYQPPADSAAGGSPPLPGTLQQAVLGADDQTVFVPAWGASVSAVPFSTGTARWVWTPGRSAGDTASGVFRSGAMGTAVSGDTVFVGA